MTDVELKKVGESELELQFSNIIIKTISFDFGVHRTVQNVTQLPQRYAADAKKSFFVSERKN